MQDKKICFIYNPRSGQTHKFMNMSLVLHEIVEFFADRGVSVTIKTTGGVGDGTRIAGECIKEGYTHVVACGGDGTINEVVNGIIGEDMVMGIIPLGTENVLAKAMKVPLDVPGACLHFWNAGEKVMDIGNANGRNFLIVSGMGLDAQVVAEMEPEVKELMGSLGFLLKGASALFMEEEDFIKKFKSRAKIRFLDQNKEFETDFWGILVGNISYYSGTVQIALNARPDDGLLHVIIFTYPESGDLVPQMLDVFSQNILLNSEIKYFTSTDLEITTHPPVFCQSDGEIIGKTPVRFYVKPGVLKVKF